MARKKVFGRIPEKTQKDFERRARLEYGPQTVNDSIRRWNSYTTDQQNAIFEEGNHIYWNITDALEAGMPPTDPEVQKHFARWHEHLRSFYEPTFEIMRGLAEGYKTPEFRATFERLHADLADYLCEGITQYVDDLETAEIQRMLDADDHEADQNKRS